MKNRVVVTGMGVVSPNGVGIPAFVEAIKQGRSGVKFDRQLAELNFSCQISATPEVSSELIHQTFTELELRNFNSSGILYGVIAALEAWTSGGLKPVIDEPDWNSGTIFGSGTSGIEKFRESIYKIDNLETRKLGSTSVAQTMNSGVSAYISGKLGLGNQVSTNSSACTTGTESILMAYDRLAAGKAKRMIAGSTSDSGPYIWGGFDAMRVCTFKHNDNPQSGSRPLSSTSSGFVPGSGAGALLLETLESAMERGAKIYCEVLGGEINSGGQMGVGSMTAPNPSAVIRCIEKALSNCNVSAEELTTINGHLTATSKDSLEINNWKEVICRNGASFPVINSLKGMTGHTLSAAGSIECVASVLQIAEGFVFPNINCEDIHPEIAASIGERAIPQKMIEMPVDTVIKASFGFGDVNACVIFKKFT